MNRTTVLRRKLVYLMILVVMLIPLYLLGQPSGGGGEGGGRLAQLRGKYDIAESDLGEISPASETMKLASLGLRGVAASLLWKKSHDYRVLHEWDRLKATLNNIALLQPHFDKVWEFQAHNLAYNVSTEFDDYRQRYEMVREGTEFLTKGVNQNRKAPRLVWYTGWFYGQKMGMSERKSSFVDCSPKTTSFTKTSWKKTSPSTAQKLVVRQTNRTIGWSVDCGSTEVTTWSNPVSRFVVRHH